MPPLPLVAFGTAFPGRISAAALTCEVQVDSLGKVAPTGRVVNFAGVGVGVGVGTGVGVGVGVGVGLGAGEPPT